MKTIFILVLVALAQPVLASPILTKFSSDLCRSLKLSGNEYLQCAQMGSEKPNHYSAALHICHVEDEDKKLGCYIDSASALSKFDPSFSAAVKDCGKVYAEKSQLSLCLKTVLLSANISESANTSLAPKDAPIIYPPGYVPPKQTNQFIAR